jgi:hypothetical protein
VRLANQIHTGGRSKSMKGLELETGILVNWLTLMFFFVFDQ